MKRGRKFYAIFFFSFFICVVITGVYVKNKSELEYAQMEQLVLVKSNKVHTVIASLLYKTRILSALVVQNNGEIGTFDRVAVTIMDNPAIKNLILAPKGIVSAVYPLEGNENVLGLDYFSAGAGNIEAILARDRGELVLGGPFQLIQGGRALVGRLPIYLGNNAEKDFWGIASITLNYPEALQEAELDQLKSQGFAFEIWRMNPDSGERQVIASSDYTYDKNSRYVEKPLQIMNAEWFFRISPIRAWYQHPETWIFSLIGLLISWLVASLVIHNHDLLRIKGELEALSYVDSLTGAINRRGLFKALEELCSQERKFIVCYLDLNKFKKVNDTFGHAIGDELLRYFSDVFLESINNTHIFSRIGGDEFILVFKDIEDEQIATEFLLPIYQKLKKPLKFNGSDQLIIDFSVGMAIYPRDTDEIDELIVYADQAMYKNKS